MFDENYLDNLEDGEVNEDTSADDTGSESEEENEEGSEDEGGAGASDGSDDSPGEGEKESNDEPAESKTYKLKIDGEEVEATEEQLVRMAQMSAASHKRFQEASSLTKNSKLVLEAAKKDPIGFLNHPQLGLSKAEIRAALETYLGEQIMYEQMTEEQKRTVDNENELKRLKEEKLERDAKEEQAKKQTAEQHYQASYEKEFLGALQTVDIPKTPESVSRMASYMSKALSKGIDLTATQAAQLVKEDYGNEFNNLFANMEPDKLAGFIGDKTLTKLQKAQAKKLLKNNIRRDSGSSDDIKTPKKKKGQFSEPGSFGNYLDSIENS